MPKAEIGGLQIECQRKYEMMWQTELKGNLIVALRDDQITKLTIRPLANFP